MLLDRLQIQAFRGIRQNIDLSLDAPITVLLAANGTAKTSVCDAAEWLLTGRVRRLQPGLIAADTVRNLYSVDLPTRVVAAAHWRGHSKEIERSEPGSIRIPNANGAARRPSTTAKFLEQLTPEYVGQTSRSRNVEESRAEWLRAVRFFASDSLTLLLDDSEDAERVRNIAFAQLLGVGPVGRRIEGLRGVRLQIDSPRAALTSVQEKIFHLELKLQAEQSAASEPYFARADALLREVAAALSTALPDILTRRREAALSLREWTATARRAQETNRALFAKVQASLPAYEAARTIWHRWQQEDRPARSRQAQDNLKQRETLQKELRELGKAGSELTDRLGVTNILLGQTQAALAHTQREIASGESLGRMAIGETRAARQTAARAVQAAEVQWEKWKRFADEFPKALRGFHQFDLLEKQRLALSQAIPSAEDQESVERRLREATLSLKELRAQLQASNDRWQHWGAEVRAQTAFWRNQSWCPLCGHDHGGSQALHIAIEDVLARQPAANQEKADRLAQLETVIAESRTAAATIDERRKQLANTEKMAAAFKAEHARFVKLAEGLGFTAEIFPQPDAMHLVLQGLKKQEENVANARQAADRAAAEVDLVEMLHHGLRETTQDLRTALPNQAATPDLPADPSLAERAREAESLLRVGQAQIETLRAGYEQSVRTGQALREKLSVLERTFAEQEAANAPLARQAAEAGKNVESIEESWRHLSAEPLNAAALDRLSEQMTQRADELARREDQLKQAEQHLDLAEQATREEAARSQAGQALIAGRREQAALLRIDLLRTKLDSAIEESEQQLSHLLSTQIRPLLRSISSFYLRTQGNPFIDRIGVDDDSNNNVLRWLGQLDGARPLKAFEMSQGQRQDLALAIFLARARRERGTFILDEPLAHLDDLNRVAFFDTLRAMVAQSAGQAQPLRLVITTASWSLARHLKAKFQNVRGPNNVPMLRVLELLGDPRSAVEVRQST